MKRIAEPKVVISDGGTGVTKALKYVWPLASHQRCLFHAFCQVRRYITMPLRQWQGEIYYRSHVIYLK